MSETLYPSGYRSCPVCGAYLGAYCTTVGTAIIDGVVHGPSTKLEHPHKARKRRSGW